MYTDKHNDIHKLHTMLTSACAPAIVTHTKPDGDAIGSCIAMYSILKDIYNRHPHIILANPAPENLDFLYSELAGNDIVTYEKTPAEASEIISQSDLIICLDFNAFHRTDALCGILESAQADKVLIDHHLAPDSDRFSLVFSETEISSASELLYHIAKNLPPINGDLSRLPKEAGIAFMTGMTTDTNNFSNSVYPSTFAMASELIEAGIDRNFVLRNIYNRFKESRIRLQGHILKDLMKITADGVAYIVLDKSTMEQYNVEEGDTEGFVNIPLSIYNVVMSILIKEDNGYARVSIRSKEGTSANQCSRRYFNGGGHENAAGGRLYFGKDITDITQAAEYIETRTHIFMNESSN